MAYTTGTVTDFTDLAITLAYWLTSDPATPGLDWIVEDLSYTKNDTGLVEPFGSDCGQMVLSNTGISGTEKIVIGVRVWKLATSAVYGWDLNCYPAWVPGQLWNGNASWHGQTTYDATYNHFSTYPCITLMDAAMTYWFFSNKQRIIVIVKTGSSYQCCYLGYGNRLGSPSEYPCPVMALGCSVGNLAHSDQSATHRWFLNPPAFFFNTPAGEARTPLWIPGASYWNFPVNPGEIVGVGGTLLNACYAAISTLGTLLTFDGVRHIVNPNLQAEDTFTANKKQWFVTQNNHRITMYDFMAIDTGIPVTTTTTTTTSSSSTTTTTTTTAP